jgi:uncharacterized membrane protein YhfC
MDVLLFTHFLNGLLMFAMPVGLAIFLTARWKLGARLWLIGAGTFILSQIGHIPFNELMTQVLIRCHFPPDSLSTDAKLVFQAVFLGLSAGLFEELARYLMFRWWARDARSWRKGVLTGAGHGGAEAILLGVVVLYAFLQFVALRNEDLSKFFSADQLALAREQVSAYWSMAWPVSLLGIVERLFTIPTQIALAVLVLQTFTRRQWFWVWLAVLYHAALDTGAVLLSANHGLLATEAYAGGFAVLSLLLILRLRSPEPPPPEEPPPAAPAPRLAPRPIEATPETLDKTRYT